MQHVRVVIPCRNERNYIGLCLDALVNCKKDLASVSVQVIDGFSDDGTREIVSDYASQYDFISLHDNLQRTTPYALNIGLRKMDFDIGIILGAHSVIDENFIDRNVQVLSKHPEVGCSGGIIRNVHENDWSEIISMAMSSVFGVGNAHFRTGGKSGYVDTVAFGAYRREVFECVGFFDEDLARNQDDEFNFRVIRGNFKIFLDPTIRSDYYVRGSITKLFRQYHQYGYWKVFVNKKHRAVTSLRQLAPPLWVLYLSLGWLSIFIQPLAMYLYLAILALYFSVAVVVAARFNVKSFKRYARLVLTFFVLHFSYGTGYLKGVWDFYAMNLKPSTKSEQLTR